MGELLPILGGAIVGAAALRMAPGWWRRLLIAAGSVVAGALASFVNGELEISAGFLLIDVPLALLGALIVLFAAARMQPATSEERT